MPAHRPDAETSGVLLLAKSKPVLVTLVNWFSAEKPGYRHLALVEGAPAEDRFTVEAKIVRHPLRPGFMRVDSQHGKRSLTVFEVREKIRRFHPLAVRGLDPSAASDSRPPSLPRGCRPSGTWPMAAGRCCFRA